MPQFDLLTLGAQIFELLISSVLILVSSLPKANGLACANPEQQFREFFQAAATVAPVVVVPHMVESLPLIVFVSLTVVGYRITCKAWTSVCKEADAETPVCPEHLREVEFTEIPLTEPLEDLEDEVLEQVLEDLHGIPKQGIGLISMICSLATSITQNPNGNICYHLRIRLLDVPERTWNFPLLTAVDHPYVANSFTAVASANDIAFFNSLETGNDFVTVLKSFLVLWPMISEAIHSHYDTLQVGDLIGTGRGCQLAFLYLIMQNEGIASLLYGLRTSEGASTEVLANILQTAIEAENPYELPPTED